MDTFQAIACIIAHSPIEAAFDSSAVFAINEIEAVPIPLWDKQLHRNQLSFGITGNRGRVSGRAFGLSNPVSNSRSRVGVTFRFRFLIRTDQVIFEQGSYRFSVTLRQSGEIVHFPAGTSFSDDRQPLAQTTAQMATRIRVFTLDQENNVTSDRLFPTQVDHSRTVVFPAEEPDTVLSDTIEVSREIRLPGYTSPRDKFIIFSVDRRIRVDAIGVYSDCTIRGIDGPRFRVFAENARIQKVLQPEDPCFEVFNS